MSPKKFYILILVICFLSAITLASFGAAVFLPMAKNLFNKDQKITYLDKPIENPTSPAIGPENAKLQVTIFGDFLCPFSKATSEVLSKIAKNYPKDIRVIWKDFPNEKARPNAPLLAGAARCAQKQGKFWKFHDLLFENQKTLKTKNPSNALLKLADDAGLDRANFINCISKEETLALVEYDFNEGKSLKISGTPSLFINDIIKINGMAKYEELEEYIK